jgi:(E)-4-hydroxy-3-methylbut-2-enyl-diphosphate synthase
MIGAVRVGGGAPVAVQSMTMTPTRDVEATVDQLWALEATGCEIARVAVLNEEDAKALPAILEQVRIPIVADIHFNYRLALSALDAGVDKLRLNPGNIGSESRVREVVARAKERDVPIRVGVNAGSLEKRLLERYGGPTPEAMVESALDHVAILERMGFEDIVISVKASEVPLCVRAYFALSERVQYPLHVGITESGTVRTGSIRSAAGMGTLLWSGIGDTMRVSLAGDPVEEVRTAFDVLTCLGLRESGIQVIGCPSCGRAQVDITKVTQEVEDRIGESKLPIKVAVMGCAVNGPGEARGADLAICAGKDQGLIYIDGEKQRMVSEAELADAVVDEVRRMEKEAGLT